VTFFVKKNSKFEILQKKFFTKVTFGTKEYDWYQKTKHCCHFVLMVKKNSEIFELDFVFRVDFDSDPNPNAFGFGSGAVRSRIRIRIGLKIGSESDSEKNRSDPQHCM